MDSTQTTESRVTARIGGASLIAAAVGFIAVFSYLAARFNYPAVLDGKAADVLPDLLTLGANGRVVWVIYAFIPMLLIPAGIAANGRFRTTAPNAARAALVMSVLAAVSMFVGLARWPGLHWKLAEAYGAASPEGRVAIDAMFSGLNTYLGNFIGEFVGEVSLSGFFMLTGLGLVRSGMRKSGYAGVLAGAGGVVAALRNVTDVVQPIADLNNYVLPLWLIILGVILFRNDDRARHG
jgi:hypothetical protein